MTTTSHPEQIIGNVWLTWNSLKKHGIRVQHRHQALGAICVDAMRKAGWSWVDTAYFRKLQADVEELERARDERDQQIEELSSIIRRMGESISALRQEFP